MHVLLRRVPLPFGVIARRWALSKHLPGGLFLAVISQLNVFVILLGWANGIGELACFVLVFNRLGNGLGLADIGRLIARGALWGLY